MKAIFRLLLLSLILCCCAFCAAASGGGLQSVAFRGDTSSAPASSREAIEAAFGLGADYVSVSVQKTKDGAFVLLEDALLSSQCDTQKKAVSDCTKQEVQRLHLKNENKTVSESTVLSLEEAVALCGEQGGLILDNAWDMREEICPLLETLAPRGNVFLRTFDSAKKVLAFLEQSGTTVPVIAVYDGNIVFNAISHWNRLREADLPLVQFQSKNYFNVFYQSFTAKRFRGSATATALAPMYDENLCGKRSDDVTGWDDLVSRGFYAIETSNIGGLTAYFSQCEAAGASLKQLLGQSESVDPALYSSHSAARLRKAMKDAQGLCDTGRASLSQLQRAQSNLQNALHLLTPITEKDTQPGSFNVTPAKIVVIVIFGGLLLGFDIFVYRKKKKT